MLTDEKKTLIQAEEHYRHEIASKIRSEFGTLEREAIDIERNLWSKVNDFLNSNVGMWLLSTVLVTGGAGMYQTMQHHYEVKLRNHNQLITHQFEVASRIQNMKYFLRKAQTIGDAQLALKSVFLSKTPVNPDVEKLSLSVIYFNIYQIQGVQNKEAMELVRKLEDQEYILQSQKASDPLPDAERQKLLSWVDELEKIELQESKTRAR